MDWPAATVLTTVILSLVGIFISILNNRHAVASDKEKKTDGGRSEREAEIDRMIWTLESVVKDQQEMKIWMRELESKRDDYQRKIYDVIAKIQTRENDRYAKIDEVLRDLISSKS